MRPRVPWMTDVDRLLLEWLDEKAISAPPKVIYVNLDESSRPSYAHVNRRLRTLHDHGLLAKDDEANGYYLITDLGKKYLHDPDAEADEFK